MNCVYMYKNLAILLIPFVTFSAFHNNNYGSGISEIPVTDSCKTETDSLTKRRIYITAETEAKNEGGMAALMRRYAKIKLDTIPDDYDTEFLVAFIVESDGSITGERILKDKTRTVGIQMLAIAKTFKWSPAICNAKKVPMLRKLYLRMCLGED